MNTRTLGRTGIEVSEIGYGAWGIGRSQWLGAPDDVSLTAYVLSHPALSTVIPGMRSVRNAERNVAVGDGRGLPAELVDKLHAHRWDGTSTRSRRGRPRGIVAKSPLNRHPRVLTHDGPRP